MRTTLGDLQNSRIPKEVGECPTGQKIIDWTNNAIQRLLYKGHWFGTYQKVVMCAQNGCITLPPQVATLEKVAICGRPIPVHDLFFEFMENGAGTRNSFGGSCPSSSSSTTGCGQFGSCGIPEANYRGRFPSYADIIPTGKKLHLVCDVSQDVGKTVLCLGYDDNGNWIRTLQNGIYADGEIIALAQSGGTDSVNNFASLSDIQPPSNLQGQWWLYEKTVSTASLRMIGHYQYWETRPNYARYFFPSIKNSTSTTSGSCNQTLVEAIVKLEFIPVKLPTDYLIIGNLPALQEMIVGLKNAENESNGTTRAGILAAATAAAVSILNDELDHELGSGRRMGIDVIGSSVGSLDPVENFI